ncbi:MAG TPA: LacI family transcriptional regulator [Firmicutes bacterium]|nr:LacI family transcriptional regulator [Bacillota bacterium]
MVTIKDVAKAAGVSPATVSLALNNNDKVNRETRKRVQAVARSLNYIPNARAKALVEKSTKIIGLVIPEIHNPFFSEMAQAIKDYLQDSDYSIILCGTDNNPDLESKYINMFKGGLVDGAIFSCITNVNNEVVHDLARNYLPLVYIDRVAEDEEVIPMIKSNLAEGAYQLTRHLLDLGHRKIAFIGRTDEERFQGYLKGMQEAGCPVIESYIFDQSYTFDQGIAAGKTLLTLPEKPTGVVCFNDEVALGLTQFMVKAGRKIPTDLSVCGIDNTVSRYYNPEITTIDVPKQEMGRTAARLLLKMIKGEKIRAEERFIHFPVTLIKRDSTAPPR